jgi:hypothetical protein
MLEQRGATVVKLIALISEARIGDKRIGTAEIDLRRLEDQGEGLRCWLNGKAEVGKDLLHAVAAHQKIGREQ